MSGAQHAVLWLGFGLIIVKLLTTSQWSQVWGTLKDGTSISITGISSSLVNPQSILGEGQNAKKNSNTELHGVTGLPFTPAI